MTRSEITIKMYIGTNWESFECFRKLGIQLEQTVITSIFQRTKHYKFKNLLTVLFDSFRCTLAWIYIDLLSIVLVSGFSNKGTVLIHQKCLNRDYSL